MINEMNIEGATAFANNYTSNDILGDTIVDIVLYLLQQQQRK